jgi:hypothetical protein
MLRVRSPCSRRSEPLRAAPSRAAPLRILKRALAGPWESDRMLRHQPGDCVVTRLITPQLATCHEFGLLVPHVLLCCVASFGLKTYKTN